MIEQKNKSPYGAICLAAATLGVAGCADLDTTHPANPAPQPPAASAPDLAGAEMPALPLTRSTSMTIKETGTFVTNFNLFDGRGRSIGTINKESNDWGKPVYAYKDASGNLIARADQKNLSWGNTINIFDETGRQIGTVDEKGFTGRNYEIKDANGKVIATSVSNGAFSFRSGMTITGNDGEQFASVQRTGSFGNDTWSVEINSAADFDHRLVMFIATYKTYADNQK